MSRIITKAKLNYNPKKNAFPYQTQAFLSVKDLDYCAIFHEQGLGKTKIAIDLILYWLQSRDIDTVIIVTKKQLIKNWTDEFSIHTHLKPKVLSNNKGDNYYVLNSPAKVIITNFETISTEKGRIKLFLKGRDVAMIVDESTKLKNPEARITQNFFEISSLLKIKVIMTGTPVANRPYDIWSQIFFLDEGHSLGVSFEEFKSFTNLSNTLSTDNNAREAFETTVAGIYKRIASFSIRETKDTAGIELPQKIYKSCMTEFSPLQQAMYNKVLYDLELEVKKNGKRVIDDESEALKRLIRLVQISSNPALVDDSYNEISGKEKQLDLVVEEIMTKGEKCIVWSSFIKNIDYFTKKYSKYKPRKIHGSMAIIERGHSVDIFMGDDLCKILFATPQAAKEGLTLTAANHVVFYDRGFNLDDYLQAQDRIHRISQTRTCYIYNLMIKDSIDEWINKLLDAKQYAAFLAQGDITKERYAEIADYSYGELIKEVLRAGEDENEY